MSTDYFQMSPCNLFDGTYIQATSRYLLFDTLLFDTQSPVICEEVFSIWFDAVANVVARFKRRGMSSAIKKCGRPWSGILEIQSMSQTRKALYAFWNSSETKTYWNIIFK